jgi:DNA-directed RNA polymerase subunit M/transcription elongation factor TFIIS
MSGEGLVEKLLCPVDQSILFSNQDLEDRIYLYCLECKYKKNIGTSTYENIVRAVNSVNKK